MNGAMAGGLAAVLINIGLSRRRGYLLDIPDFCSGVLGGLVSITACASVITTWEALIIGFIGGLLTILAVNLVELAKVDDPVGCIAVHWFSGVWSMIGTGFFAQNTPTQLDDDGIFRGGNGNILGWNILACIVVSAWNGGLTAIVFLVLKYTIGIRMSLNHELRGSDEVEHNVLDQETITYIRNTHSLGRRVSTSAPPPTADINLQHNKTTNTAMNRVEENIEMGLDNTVNEVNDN